MRLSLAGKLMAAAIGAKVVAEGLRYVANQIPSDGMLDCVCPHCGVETRVPHSGTFNCWNCSNDFTVTAVK